MAGTHVVNTAIRLREMAHRDVAAVATLERMIDPQPWSARVFSDELTCVNRRYVVATDRGEVVGYGGLLIVEDDAHIMTLAVHPEARRFRLGTCIMLDLIGRALNMGSRHLTLEVRVSNAAARSLYQRFGFVPVGLRRNYYRNEDALVMWATDIDSDDYADRITLIKAQMGRGVWLNR